jgi:1-acyl-sn-glycerol-3-phosphate acyltransferase
MSETSPSERLGADPTGGMPAAYRLFRRLLRSWLGAFFGKIRLLRAEVLPGSGPALLVIRHPPGFLDALILVAAFERQVSCWLPGELLRGPLRGPLGRALGMFPYEASGTNWLSAVAAGGERLAKGAAVVIFSGPRTANAADSPRPTLAAATLAIEAESRLPGPSGLALYPVDLFLPVAPALSGEPLIYLDAPVSARDYFLRDGKPADRALALATALDQTCRENAFGLSREELRRFLSDLEEVVRRDLGEDWEPRPNWKQTTEDFQLSRFAVALVEQLNGFNPGRLVALRESLRRYREAERVCSLQQFEVEVAPWFKSPWRRIGGWIETLVGAPIAAYGFLNHFLILLVLFAARLLRKGEDPTPAGRWLARALVVLAGYTVQTALCHHFLGRAAAGYYLLSLPVSGAYLWRYGWLARHRMRPLYLAARSSRRRAKLRRMRKDFLSEFDTARDAYAELIGAPR